MNRIGHAVTQPTSTTVVSAPADSWLATGVTRSELIMTFSITTTKDPGSSRLFLRRRTVPITKPLERVIQPADSLDRLRNDVGVPPQET